jgi:putative ABC transport system permease protein
MNRWLETFAYAVHIGPGVFFWAGGLSLFIALLTVSYLSLRAARTNPIQALRYE